MMQGLIEGFMQQLHNGMDLGRKISFTEPKNEIHHVVVGAMGGSGMAADLVENIISPRLKVPFVVCKNYDPPVFMSQHTLFIASSFSGNTEETLAVLEQAIKKRAKIFCIASGGGLIELARKKKYDHVVLPNEAPCPRAFIGYNFIQILFALKGYKLINGFFTRDLQESIELLDEKNEEIQQKAGKMAEEIKGKIPVIYSDNRNRGAILRFQQQINENSKQLCHINFFPEMNHNELTGWGLPKNAYENLIVYLIRTSYDHERVNKRLNICKKILAEKASKVVEIQASGHCLIAQTLYLIHLFDWVSFYLSELNQVDILDSKAVDYLKKQLTES